jgi:hypothetical protein
MTKRGYIEFQTCWKNSVVHILRNIKTSINYFLQTFRTLSTHISHRKNLAEHWDLPNTGIFYSKNVVSMWYLGSLL